MLVLNPTGSQAYNIYMYMYTYHISDMIPVALPPRVAGDGLKDPCSYFV